MSTKGAAVATATNWYVVHTSPNYPAVGKESYHSDLRKDNQLRCCRDNTNWNPEYRLAFLDCLDRAECSVLAGYVLPLPGNRFVLSKTLTPDHTPQLGPYSA
jgi:hypothetical protein